ncbi:MAG TPA: BadF/BadG/BcrA/BcrD ATPase family protein [Gemmatimonadales bacterium]|nr:BadF/BadG/BcrA/BcrD ATPase family protein [Gemmatimonadales bacterium]
MTKVLIGADVGGTKTAAAVLRDGEIVGRVEGPGAAIRPGRALASAATIAETVRRALSAAGVLQGDVLVVGAAGAGRPVEARELQQALRGEGVAHTVVVTTDIAIALEGALGPGAGIVLAAGTGSIAIARDSAGESHRAGGYGWQMGDEGSGYAIGRAALGAVSRATDGRGAETTLSTRLLEATRSPDFDELVRWTATAGPPEVAALAPHVLAAAEQGDPTARAIVHYAAEELAGLVLHLRRKLGGETPTVAITGGLLANPLLRQALDARLKKDGITPAPGEVDAVGGALRMASEVAASRK